MKLEFFCPRWGSDDIVWPAFFQKVKAAGYDGIEWAIPSTVSEWVLEEVFNLSVRHEMPIIAQHFDTDEPNFYRHLEKYCAWLDRIQFYPTLKINSQTGKDYFTMDQNLLLIEAAGWEVLHETHRNKFSFACHLTAEYLECRPSLRLTLDVSHWVCVAESFLQDQSDALALAISRTDHLHARIGFPEGPQVVDPRVAEWQEALEHHLMWWDRVAARFRDTGQTLTVTPEAGPFPYMVCLPKTCQPIADQWEINEWMMGVLKKRYS